MLENWTSQENLGAVVTYTSSGIHGTRSVQMEVSINGGTPKALNHPF